MGPFGMLKIVTRNVLSRPATRLYPFVKREAFAGTRGSIAIDIKNCTFCTLCQKKCPAAAIVVNRQEKTWEIDRLRCVSCNACVEACPKKCLEMLTSYSPAMTARGIDRFVQQAVAA